ncbi:uncharacterized protein LOC144453196 [Glandiceps talaboti]
MIDKKITLQGSENRLSSVAACGIYLIVVNATQKDKVDAFVIISLSAAALKVRTHPFTQCKSYYTLGVYGSDAEERLHKVLLSNYSRHARPSRNAVESVQLTLGLTINQFLKVNVKDQEIETRVWVVQQWQDYRLQWNPADYDNLTFTVVSLRKLWIPDTALINNAHSGMENAPLVTVFSVPATVYSDGSVIHFSPGLFHTICAMDITYFPMDTQNCPLKFGLWTYGDNEVQLKTNDKEAQIEGGAFIPSTEWEYMGSTVKITKHAYQGVPVVYTYIIYGIQLNRKPTYYVMYVILPCIILSCLTVVVFILPPHSGEKISLSVNLLVATYIFNLLVADIMPATSTTIPLISEYILFNIFMVSFSVVISAIVSNCYHKSVSNCKVPSIVQKLILNKCCLRLLMISRSKKARKVDLTMTDNDSGSDDSYEGKSKALIPSQSSATVTLSMKRREPRSASIRTTFENKVLRLMDQMLKSLQKKSHLHNLSIISEDDEEQNEWFLLAVVIDRIFLVLYAIMSVLVALAILPQIVSYKDFNLTSSLERTLAGVGLGSSGVTGSIAEENLHKILFEDYARDVRPSEKTADSVTIKFWLSLNQLMAVNVKQQVIKTRVNVNLIWNDYRLKWDPDEYEGLNVTTVPSTDIWLPDASLQNSANNDFKNAPVLTMEDTVWASVYSDGTVTQITPHVFTTVCEMDITYFPMDKQHCPMKFGLWTYVDNQVHIELKVDKILTNAAAYIENTEWDIVGSNTSTKKQVFDGDSFTNILYYILLKRKPTFYIVNLVLPCNSLSALIVVVFVLPPHSGEKISLSVSILLAMYVFNLLVADIMPETSTSVPLISMYLLFNMFMVGFSILFSSIASSVYQKSVDECKIPYIVKKVFLHPMLLKILWISRQKQPRKMAVMPVKENGDDSSSDDSDSMGNNGFNYKRPGEQRFGDTLRETIINGNSGKPGIPLQNGGIVRETVINGHGDQVIRPGCIRKCELITEVDERHPFESNAPIRTRVHSRKKRSTKHTTPKQKFQNNVLVYMEQMLKYIQKKDQPLHMSVVNEVEEQNDWYLLAVVMDRVLLVTFTVVTLLMAFAILPQIMNYDDLQLNFKLPSAESLSGERPSNGVNVSDSLN